MSANNYLTKGGSMNLNSSTSLKGVKPDWSQLEQFTDQLLDEMERPSQLTWKQKSRSMNNLG
jgi:hypothetical protein